MADKKPAGESGGKARGKPAKARVKRDAEGAVSPNAWRAMLVVNPVAGGGEALRVWDGLQEVLRDLGLDFDYRFTEQPGHAVELAEAAAGEGFGTVVATGGNGTLSEVVNGLMAGPAEGRPLLGVIPTGRSNDFCRDLEIPRDWQVAASQLVSERRHSVDVGRMEYLSPQGTRTGYFVNVAGLGFEGEVTERAAALPEALTRTVGGVGAYLLSFAASYGGAREKDVELQVDGKVCRVLAASVIVANCRFWSKMCIAPDAECDDGLFDIVVVGSGFGSPVIDVPAGQPAPEHTLLQRLAAKADMAVTVLPRVYRGTHVEDESVLVLHGKKVKVLSDDRLVLQADGEIVGEAPFRAEVIPSALTVIA